MKWEDHRESSNIEDRRSSSNYGSRRRGGNMMALLPIAKMLLGTKIGRIVLVIGVIAYFFGFNPLALLDPMSSMTTQQQTSKVVNEQADDKTARFVSAVLAQTEDIWSEVFKKYGATYQEPKLVLFRGSTKSGCGFASSQTGPFYCPADRKIYLDLSFFDELARRHNAPGDFASAYVIAHEVGHHVQNITGTLDKVQEAKRKLGFSKKVNALQVKVELQADCYAGLWAHYSKKNFNSLEEGDIQEALNAASAIGDDTLQKKSQGYVVPDSFTHGSSAQRMAWFKKGFDEATLEACNSF